MQRDPGHYGPETLRLLRSADQVSAADYAAACRPATAAPGRGRGLRRDRRPAQPGHARHRPADRGVIRPRRGHFEQAYNLTGAPAIALPCGRTAGGLPVGLQLSALPGQDQALLAAAAVVESILAGLFAELSVSIKGIRGAIRSGG